MCETWVAISNRVTTSSLFKNETFETRLEGRDSVSQAHVGWKCIPGRRCIPGTAKEAPVTRLQGVSSRGVGVRVRTQVEEWETGLE